MSLLEKHSDKVDQFIAVCHHLAAHQYVTGHGGNLAWKLEDDVVLITPTQTNKATSIVRTWSSSILKVRSSKARRAQLAKHRCTLTSSVSALTCNPFCIATHRTPIHLRLPLVKTGS